MGNTCIPPRLNRKSFFFLFTGDPYNYNRFWRYSPTDPDFKSEPEIPLKYSTTESESEFPMAASDPQAMNRTQEVTSQGHMLITSSVLGRKTENLKDLYILGRKLGQGQFGTTFLCIEKGTGKEYACKSIAKRKLVSQEDVDDVRREIRIMHHLSGHPNVVAIKGAYEDSLSVHLVMELCAGGELFDRILQKGHYSERKAAHLIKTIVGIVETCHSLGVMHRDLKPENFLFSSKGDSSPLKAIDFGLSIFFKPGLICSYYYHCFHHFYHSHHNRHDHWCLLITCICLTFNRFHY